MHCLWQTSGPAVFGYILRQITKQYSSLLGLPRWLSAQRPEDILSGALLWLGGARGPGYPRSDQVEAGDRDRAWGQALCPPATPGG